MNISVDLRRHGMTTIRFISKEGYLKKQTEARDKAIRKAEARDYIRMMINYLTTYDPDVQTLPTGTLEEVLHEAKIDDSHDFTKAELTKAFYAVVA